MRFTCEKCGRTYAADEGLSGRGFRIRCRQCGELIVVAARGASPGNVPTAVGTPVPGQVLAPGSTEAIPVALRAVPAEAPGADDEDPFASLAAELAAIPEAPPLLPQAPWPDRPGPGPAGSGGVPDGSQAPWPELVPGPPPGGAPPVPAPETERALAEIGRMSEAITGSSPLSVKSFEAVRAKPAPRTVLKATPVPRPRARPRPRGRRWIAAGVGLALGISGAVAAALLLERGRAPEISPPAPVAPEAAPPAAAAPPEAPARPPPGSPAARPAPPPPASRAPGSSARAPPAAPPEPRPAASQEKGKRKVPRQVAARPEAQAPRKAESRAAPRPEPRGAARSEAPPAAPRAAASPSPAAPPRDEKPLDEQQIQATIARHTGAFEACSAQARQAEPQLVAEPRRVTMTMTVSPDGKVLYPTLDDAELTGSALGACLKREALRMKFPSSGGEAVRVRLPLVLR